MKLVLLIWIGCLLATQAHADTPPRLQAPLVADEGLQGHRDYLNSRLALGQFDAMDSLLASLAVGQRARIKVQARDVSIALSADNSSSIVNRLPARIRGFGEAAHPAQSQAWW